jgi:uncharacterized protein (TIGR00251 family)
MDAHQKASRVTPEGLLVFLRVTPNADRDAILGPVHRDDGRTYLSAKVRAVPDKGKANKAVIALCANFFGVAKSNISIESGAQSRTKTVLIQSDEPHSLAAKLKL